MINHLTTPIYIYIYIDILGVSKLMHAINEKNVMRNKLFTLINCIIRFDPNILQSSQRGWLSVVCNEGTVARVSAQQAGYFENKVARKITEPWVAFFWILL